MKNNIENIENLEPYLQDISASTPQGSDVKYEQIYDEIREAAREDVDLPQGIWVQDLKSADWEKVQSLCTFILKTQSKDLQICAWLLEAWMCLYNMKGLRQGFRLLLEMSSKYWEIAYPPLNPNDIEYRSSPYNWINEKLSERINRIQVSHPSDPDLLVYSFADYIDTNENIEIKIVSSATQERATKERQVAGFKNSLKKTDTQFFKDLLEDTKETQLIIKKLQAFLDEKLGKNGPSLYRVQDKLAEFNNFTNQILMDRNQTPGVHPLSSPLFSEVEEPSPPTIDGILHNRTEAYAVIEKAADYLEKLDPHSPAPYLIKRAVRWGTLPFDELLKEMVRDPNALKDLKNLLGVGADDFGPSVQNSGQTLGPATLQNTSNSIVPQKPTPSPPKPFWTIEE